LGDEVGWRRLEAEVDDGWERPLRPSAAATSPAPPAADFRAAGEAHALRMVLTAFRRVSRSAAWVAWWRAAADAARSADGV
jgi:hypothetical protein